MGLYLAGEPDSALLDWRYLNDTAQLPTSGVATATLHFGTPTTPGTYEFRFFMEGGYGRLATSGPLVVPQTPAQIAINGVAPPDPVAVMPGSTVTVSITGGPGNPTDWVALAAQGAANSSYVAWQYLNGSTVAPASGLTGTTVSFTMPSTAGAYEARLFAANTYQRITTSAPITTSADPAVVTIALTAPFPGTTFNGPASLDLAATATVSGGAIVRVEFYAGATLIGSDTTAPYALTWETPPLGAHVLTAAAVDSTAQVTTSAPVAVTIAAAGATAGVLGLPVATPPSGVYGAGQSVALMAAPGTTVRYTVNGTDPTPSSPAYTGPFALTSSLVLKARAYQGGWTESGILTQVYQVDTTPPTVIAKVSPQPNQAGWNNTPVVVSFDCFDAGGVSVCPSAVPLSQDGSAIVVSGTAIDVAGNQTTVTTTVNIDRTPVNVAISSPANGSTVSGNVAVSGLVTDALSGAVAATCNGEPASISGSALTCTVPAPPGPATIIVHARDAAGNGRSASVRVGPNSPRTALMMSPNVRAATVGDFFELKVVDQIGRNVEDSTFSSSDANIAVVTLSPDSPPLLQAKGVGTATISAAASGLTADVTITVYPGDALPAGAVKWSLGAPGSALAGLWKARARDSEDIELFTIDYAAATFNEVLVHGLNPAGEVVYSEMAPIPTGGDPLGGFLTAFNTPGALNFRLLRYAALGDGTSWEYRSSIGNPFFGPASKWSQGPDGTIYFIEVDDQPPAPDGNLGGYDRAAFVIALDGATGEVLSRTTLPPSRVCAYDSAAGVGTVLDAAPVFTMPVVGRDGAAYLNIANIIEGCSPAGGGVVLHKELGLVRITRQGAVTSTVIRDEPLGIVLPGEVAPDGQGGILARGHVGLYNPSIGDYEYELVTLHSTPSGDSEWPSSTWIGDISMAGGGSVFSRVGDQVTAQDASTGAATWSVTVAPSESVLQVQAGGGVVLYDSDSAQLTPVDANGFRALSQQLPPLVLTHRTELDELSGLMLLGTEEPYAAVSKVATEQSTDRTTFPSVTGANAEQRRGRFGIFVKGHTVKSIGPVDIGPFRHASVRVIPRNQNRDDLDAYGFNDNLILNEYGQWYFTIGAAPKGSSGDVSGSCGGTLFAEFNRPSDRNKHADDMKQLAYFEAAELDIADSLSRRAQYFIDNVNDVVENQLQYECLPDPADDHPTDPDGRDGYNSNSFVSGLLHAVELPLPALGGIFNWRYPGWRRPVPLLKFGTGF